MTARRRGPVGRALESALSGGWHDEDAATVELARTYARMVDAGPEQATKCGPLLLSVLVELGMTPRARAAVVKGGGAGDGGKRAKLVALRGAVGQDGTASVDSPAP